MPATSQAPPNEEKIEVVDEPTSNDPAHDRSPTETPPDDPNGGLPAYTLSPKWCRNCDCRHETGPETCPLRKPQEVYTDSVIDFSNKAVKTDGKSGDSGNAGDDARLDNNFKSIFRLNFDVFFFTFQWRC